MQVEISPASISGSITAPGSKSITQRAIAVAALAHGRSQIEQLAECADVEAAMKVVEGLGAHLELQGRTLNIDPGKNAGSETLHCGESGLAVRMFTSVAALSKTPKVMTGEGSLTSRPVGFFEDVLPLLGVQCETQNGLLPITVHGPLKGGNVSVDGSLSSQFLTGLLISLPLAKADSVVEVNDLKSKPYIDMTLDVMAEFGIRQDHDAYKRFRITGGQHYRGTQITVDGDWSGAAFLFVASAIAGDLRIDGLASRFVQADEAILTALSRAGVDYVRTGSSYQVKRPSNIQAFDFDATECPDLFPPMVALACHAKGVSKITGVHRLTHKESDRTKALIDVFSRMGHDLQVKEDTLLITPGEWKEAEVSSHGDHRIAMAAAVGALGGKKVIINGAESVSKSWTHFWRDLEHIVS